MPKYKKAHQWAFKVLRDWISGVSEYSVADLWCEDGEKVCNILSQFVAETNGSFYTPKTLVQLLSNLQSAAYAKNPKPCHFIDHKDIVFKPLHNVLNNMCKRLLSDGVGAQKKQSRVLTRCEEETIWETGVMGSSTPASLQNTIFFYCGLYFCLRGSSEHRDLKISQFASRGSE